MKDEKLDPKSRELAKEFYTLLQAEHRMLKRRGEPEERLEEMKEQARRGYEDAMADKATEYSVIFLEVFMMWLLSGREVHALDMEAALN